MLALERMLLLGLMLGACGDNSGDSPPDGNPIPDPRACACAASAMPDGFYQGSGTAPRLPELRQVKREMFDSGEMLAFGFIYRYGMGVFSDGPIVGTFDGCLFTGTSVQDTQVTQYEGVWSCEQQRLEGTADSAFVDAIESFVFEPAPTPWYLGDGVYRLYGSETHEIAPIGGDYPGYVPKDLAHPVEADWEMIGEAVDSASFELAKPYPALMLTWPGAPEFAFDALTDEVSGESLSSAFNSPDVGFAAHANDRPEDLAGPPDGVVFAGVAGRAGFVEVTLPDKNSAPQIDSGTGTARVRVELGAN